MADLLFSVNMSVNKGVLRNSVDSGSCTATMSETGMVSQTLTLSTTAVSISTATLSQAGLAFLQNLSTSTAQTISIGVVSGTSVCAFATLRSNEAAMLRLQAGAQYKATGTDGGRLRVDITES